MVFVRLANQVVELSLADLHASSSRQLTTIVAFMIGWNEQWYVIVPGVASVTSLDAPGCNVPASKPAEVSDVAVCACMPVLRNVTVEPAFTSSEAGVNEKSAMVTVELVADAPVD